jgi:hypothetical protein
VGLASDFDWVVMVAAELSDLAASCRAVVVIMFDGYV